MILPTSPWPRHRFALRFALAAGFVVLASSTGTAQVQEDSVTRIDLPAGRSYPLTTQNPITRISVATPDIADAVVVGERDLVINAKTNGETDIIVWVTNEPRRHYRIAVHAVADRKSVLLAVRIARSEGSGVRLRRARPISRWKCASRNWDFRDDNVFDKVTGVVSIPSPAKFRDGSPPDFGTTSALH